MADHPKLYLAPHVRACHVDGQVILLDLRRNKYLGVGGSHLHLLAHAVAGWPTCTGADHSSAQTSDLAAVTGPLLSQGLLTDQPSARGVDATVEAAIETLDTDGAIPDATVGTRRVSRFLQTAITTSVSLRCRSLLSITLAVAARRMRLERIAPVEAPDALRQAVASYAKMRPLVFTSRDQCLYDSLALINFLAREGMFPRWVIGVGARPFRAHSWVQSAGIVLNDQPEHVRQFCPILVV